MSQHRAAGVEVDHLPKLLLHLRQVLRVNLVSHTANQVCNICFLHFPLFWLVFLIFIKVFISLIWNLIVSDMLSTNSLALLHFQFHINILCLELLRMSHSVIRTFPQLSQEL